MTTATPPQPPTTPPAASHWTSARYSALSAAFGVAGSVVAKYALTDEWTEYFTHIMCAVWTMMSLDRVIDFAADEPATDASPAPSSDATLADSTALFWNVRMLFWSIRVALIGVKLLLDARMLHHFVRSMHASNSLLAATFNQCFTIILAGISGYVCFRDDLPTAWLLGCALIILGVCIVQWGNATAESETLTSDAASTATPARKRAKPTRQKAQ